MDTDEFRKKNWKVRLILAAAGIILAIIVGSMLINTISGQSWLQMYCNVNLLTEFSGADVTSSEQAGELAGTIISVGNISQSSFQYCGGYIMESGERNYFLCTDGRLYELASCKKVDYKQIIPILPDPKTVW